MDEFGSHTENEALVSIIADEIRRTGPIPFQRFMELALYHPHHGYYAGRDEVIGRRGDYLTSPEISPLFGVMIGRQLAQLWVALDRPSPFTVVEAGPGNGTLAADILGWARRSAPELYDALDYVLVERLAAQEERQRRRLGDEPRVRWMDDLPPSVAGCILSNELLDAFPVHIVTRYGSRLQELHITVEDGRFAEVWRDCSTPAIGAYLDAIGLLPPEGGRAEANLGAVDWMADAGGALTRGMVLTLDYGYPAARLYAPWRRQGTLLCFSRHTANDAPLERVGRQDITTHIDFTSVARAGLATGLQPAGFVSQAEFLYAMGIRDAVAQPVAGGAAGEEFLARYRAVGDLTDPSGLGRVRVLGLTRGLDQFAPRGFSAGDDPMAALFANE